MHTNENETTPAAIIWSQIGGRALAMIGARDPQHSSSGKVLHFRIGRNAKRISWIKIALEPDDTYHAMFFRGIGVRARAVSEQEHVYAEDLRRVIEAHTGLYTSL